MRESAASRTRTLGWQSSPGLRERMRAETGPTNSSPSAPVTALDRRRSEASRANKRVISGKVLIDTMERGAEKKLGGSEAEGINSFD